MGEAGTRARGIFIFIFFWKIRGKMWMAKHGHACKVGATVQACWSLLSLIISPLERLRLRANHQKAKMGLPISLAPIGLPHFFSTIKSGHWLLLLRVLPFVQTREQGCYLASASSSVPCDPIGARDFSKP